MELEFSPALDTLTDMVQSIISAVPNLVVGLIVLIAFLLLARGVRVSVMAATLRYRRQPNAALVLGRLAKWVTVILGLLISLAVIFPGLSAARLVEVLGLGSVAAGLAFKDILDNFFAGVLLLWQEPFRIGDQIIFRQHEGTVEKIEARATMIRTYDGRRVIVPNSQLYTDAVIVNTAFPSRRLEYDIGIGYGDDVDEAKRLILETLAGLDHVLAEPAPDVLLLNLGDFSAKLRVRWWITPPRISDALDGRDRVLRAVKARLKENGIDMPFPTQQVLLHDQTEETEGDRRHQREGWPAGKGPVPAPLSHLRPPEGLPPRRWR